MFLKTENSNLTPEDVLARPDIQTQKAMPSHLKVHDFIFSQLFLHYKCTNAIQSWPRKNYMTLILQHEPTISNTEDMLHCSDVL